MNIVRPLFGIAVITALFVLGWLLPQKFGKRGLTGFYILILPAFVAVVACVGKYEDPTQKVMLPTLAGFFIFCCLILPLSLMGLWKRMAADRPPVRWNPRISPFWLWLAIAFGVIALTPIFRFPEKFPEEGRVLYLPVVTAYSRPDLIDYPPALILLCHVLLSIALAAFAITIQKRILDNRRKRPGRAPT